MKLSLKNNRGEIATTFALLSFVVILVGAFFGSRQVVRDKVNTLFSRAQSAQVVINCDPTLSSTGCRAKISNLRFTPSSNNPNRFIFSGKLCFETLPGEPIPSNGHYFVRFYQSGVLIASDKASVGSQPNRSRCDNVGLRFRSIVALTNAACAEVTLDAGLERTMEGVTSNLILSKYNVVNSPICTVTTPTPGTTVPTSAPALCNYHTDAMIRIGSETGDVLTKQQNNTTADWGVSSDRHLADSPSVVVNKFGSKEVNTLFDPNFYINQAITTYHNDHHKFFPDNPGSKYKLGERASMTLMGLDLQRWKIIGKYCKPLSSTAVGCPEELAFQPLDTTITDFNQTCGVDIEYGWIVESLIDPILTPTPTVIEVPTATVTPTPTTIAVPTATNTPTPIPTECTMTAKYVVKDENGAVLNTNKFMVPNQWGIINNRQTLGQKTIFPGPNAEKTVQLSTADGTLKFKCSDTTNPKCDPDALYAEGEKASIRLLTDETFSVVKKSITRCGIKTNPLDYQCEHRDPITVGAVNEIPGVPLKCNMEYVFEFYVKKNACTYSSKVTLKDEFGNILTQDKMINAQIGADDGRDPEAMKTSLHLFPWGISNNKQDQNKPAIQFTKETAELEVNSNTLKFLPFDPTAQYRYGEKATIKLFHFPGYNVNKWTVKSCGTNSLDNQCDNLVGPIPGKDPAAIDGIPMKCNMKYEFEYQLTPETCDPGEFDISYGSCGGQSSFNPTQFCAPNQRPRFICKAVVRNGQTIGLRVPDPDNRCETVPSCPHNITPPSNGTWPKCQKIRGDGKYKLVFVPQGFTDMNEFLRYVTSATDWVYKVNLTSDQVKHFSFYVNTNSTQNRYYDLVKEEWLDRDALKKQGQDCDGLAQILIVRSPIYSGFTYLGGNTEPIVITTETLVRGRAVLTHELGHQFGQLNDEYVYRLGAGITPTSIPEANDSPQANCTKQEDSTCSKWRGKSYFDRIVCSRGCTTINRYRSTVNSIMAYDWLDRKFNLVSIDEWNRQIGLYNASASRAQSKLDSVNATYHNAIKLVFNQPSMNTVQLASATTVQTYPNLPINDSRHDYTISIADAQGISMYAYDVAATERLIVEGNDENGGRSETRLKNTIVAYLPYVKTANAIQITNKQGNQVFAANIADLSLAPPVENQNLCGNGICDSRNGEDNLSCSADCPIATPPVATPTPTTPAPVNLCRTTDINGDKTINTIDYAYLIKRYRQRTDIVKADLNCDGKVNAYDTSLLLGELGRRIN